jgi:hypothetical protein
MRRALLLAAAAVLMVGNTGCLLNAYSADPNMRMTQLMNQSEDLRVIEAEWARYWLTDHPSHLTPDRVDGGIAPGF